MTLGEFLNINGDDDMPLLILVGEGGGMYKSSRYIGNFGIMIRAEIMKRLNAEQCGEWNLDNAVDMTVNGVGGYVLWVSYHD